MTAKIIPFPRSISAAAEAEADTFHFNRPAADTSKVISGDAPARRSAIAADLATAKYAAKRTPTKGQRRRAAARKIAARLRQFARDPDGMDAAGRAWEDC